MTGSKSLRFIYLMTLPRFLRQGAASLGLLGLHSLSGAHLRLAELRQVQPVED